MVQKMGIPLYTDIYHGMGTKFMFNGIIMGYTQKQKHGITKVKFQQNLVEPCFFFFFVKKSTVVVLYL